MNFFVWINDQQQGPFDDETIRAMVSKGQIAKDTLACPEGGDLDWTPVGELFFQDSMPENFGLADLSFYQVTSETPENNHCLVIRLTSGAELQIKAVRLYNESALKKLNSKKAEAMKMFKGVSTGLGAFGSIDWVLEAAAVIGTTEAFLTAGASAAGTSLLEEALQEDRKLRKEGVFFPVSKIQFIENPVPGIWRAFNNDCQATVITHKTFQLTRKTESPTTTFIHNGDDFISVLTDENSVSSIRWEAIEHYVLSKIAN
jgi:hypothetical protein